MPPRPVGDQVGLWVGIWLVGGGGGGRAIRLYWLVFGFEEGIYMLLGGRGRMPMQSMGSTLLSHSDDSTEQSMNFVKGEEPVSLLVKVKDR